MPVVAGDSTFDIWGEHVDNARDSAVFCAKRQKPNEAEAEAGRCGREASLDVAVRVFNTY